MIDPKFYCRDTQAVVIPSEGGLPRALTSAGNLSRGTSVLHFLQRFFSARTRPSFRRLRSERPANHIGDQGKALIITIAALILITGCHKKTPNVPPPQAQAPGITLPPFTQPGPATATAPADTTTTTPPPPTPQPVETEQPQPGKHHREKPATESAAKIPAKTVVPGASSPPPQPQQISVGMDQSEAAHERQAAEALLGATDANLKSITRALTADETAMLEQIKSYVAQSRAAITSGDLLRANILAHKAHDLSDALVKR